MEVKIDFTIDFYTKEKINFKLFRNEMLQFYRDKGSVRKTFYLCESCRFYHEKVYNKSFKDIIIEFYYDYLPKCPISNEIVSFKIEGSNLAFSKFSNKISRSEQQIWVKNNNPNVIEHHKKLKENRKGEGNPMYGNTAWNKGIPPSEETKRKLKKNKRIVE